MEVTGAGVGVGSVRGIFAGPEVDGQFRMSDSVSRCSSDVLLCKRTPSKLLCPHYLLFLNSRLVQTTCRCGTQGVIGLETGDSC